MVNPRFLACLVVISSAGCAQLVIPQARAGSPSISFAQRPQTTVIVTEEFDPLSYRDDLLLIKPVFDRSDVSGKSMQTRPDSAGSQIADPLSDDGAVSSVISDDISGLPMYRIQVIALSSEDAAQRVAEDIRQSLNVAVIIRPEHNLFLVQAGAEKAAQAAGELRDRIVALDDDFGQAYILEPQALDDFTDFPEADTALPDVAVSDLDIDANIFVPDSERLQAFGWRVLIDQFLSRSEAEKMRQKAVKRLGREDINVKFSPPYDKVEVGNFRAETDAEMLVEKIKGKGYRNALKVRAKVFVDGTEAARK